MPGPTLLSEKFEAMMNETPGREYPPEARKALQMAFMAGAFAAYVIPSELAPAARPAAVADMVEELERFGLKLKEERNG